MMQLPTAASPAEPEDNIHKPNFMSAHSFPASPPQPNITVEKIADGTNRPVLAPHLSAPPAPIQLQSPMRHHKRTPSQHREVKETLNAKYTSDEIDGRSQHTVNQYVIREEIGRGSYGAVHLATDQFGNEFAVKEFSKSRLRKRAQSHILRRPGPGTPHQLIPGRGLNNFHRKQLGRQEDAEAKDALYLIRAEIAIMKKLNHPNLVALIEVLDDPEEDSLYMVLEMCKKGVVMKIGLDEQAKPYDSELCRTWFRDLILGIEYLHAQGIIHRDIKPDNLLLTEDDVLKIVDFGVSEMFEKPDQMLTNKSAGSPAFIPPELCQAKHGEVSGKAADVWSMGVTLFCLKYGRLPFNGNNALDMYNAIRTDTFSLPDEEDPDFVDLITRILDKNSTTRITLPEIRNHPWVTKNGSDPLLSEDENCSDMVETPNELEVNHAFTRKMDHLLCVLRAIQRFKGLVSQSRVTTPRIPHAPRPAVKEVKTEQQRSSSSPRQPSQPAERARQKSVAEEAAELIEQRKAYFQSGLHSRNTEPGQEVKEEDHTPDLTENTPLVLGIGTGGCDEFSISEPSANLVSDSPTGIDFDVYDRAFETEIKRIRSDRKSSRTRTYITKWVGEKEMDKYLEDENMIIEAGKSLASSVFAHGSSAASKGLSRVHEAREALHREGEWKDHFDGKFKESQGLQRAMETVKETSYKLADVVVSMTKDSKEKAVAQEQTD
ncbi:Pkinase-domain-containing protein [Xylariaceae sp. FL1651]|nr:Pkinase-domain-containing protein [Xylariaceae sp. FL1651]